MKAEFLTKIGRPFHSKDEIKKGNLRGVYNWNSLHFNLDFSIRLILK